MSNGRSQNYLFHEGDLDATMRGHFGKVQERVDAVHETDLFQREEESLVEEIKRDFEIIPLTLEEANQSLTREETKVDVTGDHSRYFSRDGGTHYVEGIRLRISIPFRGDPLLWKLKPNYWRSVLPYGNISTTGDGEGTLDVVIDYPANTGPESAKQRFDENMDQIRFYIDSQKRQVTSENARLPDLIRSAIHSRKKKLETHRDGLEQAFGIPIKAGGASTRQSTPRATPNRDRSRSRSEAPHQWDVFVSHASEDKDAFGRPLAEALKAKGLKVWFDEFTLRIGDSLRRSIDKGLAGARFGIVIVSPRFLDKEWPQKELDALVARESHGLKVILPVWHNVDVDYVRKYSPTLADRLASSSLKGLDGVVDDLMAAIGDD